MAIGEHEVRESMRLLGDDLIAMIQTEDNIPITAEILLNMKNSDDDLAQKNAQRVFRISKGRLLKWSFFSSPFGSRSKPMPIMKQLETVLSTEKYSNHVSKVVVHDVFEPVSSTC